MCDCVWVCEFLVTLFIMYLKNYKYVMTVYELLKKSLIINHNYLKDIKWNKRLLHRIWSIYTQSQNLEISQNLEYQNSHPKIWKTYIRYGVRKLICQTLLRKRRIWRKKKERKRCLWTFQVFNSKIKQKINKIWREGIFH